MREFRVQTISRRRRLFSLAGLAIALGFPAFAIVGNRCTVSVPDFSEAIILTATPWLTLAWVVVGERRGLDSIGLHRLNRQSLGFGLAGIVVNVAISIGVGSLNTALGLYETQSPFMTQLLQGPGLVLVLIVTNGAALTEIAFRGYAIARLGELAHGRLWIGAVAQIVITTILFTLSRGLAHGLVWLLDDIIFSLFYIWRRDTVACLMAHGVPNLIASTLIAAGVAS